MHWIYLSTTLLFQILSARCNYYHHQLPQEQASPNRQHLYKASSKLSGQHLLNYNRIRNRYHPATFSITEEELEGEGAESQVQYATYSDMGDGHEGEVIMNPQQQSSHVMATGTHGYMHNDGSHYPAYAHHQHQPEDISGYDSAGHNTPSSAPYPPALPPPPPPPPPPLPPHKSKNTPVYTYYYIGRHLWYIPLYFSIYFVIYVGLLVLKSIARHKIQFPQNLHEAATTRELHALRSLEKGKERYFM